LFNLIIGATRTIAKSHRQFLNNCAGKHARNSHIEVCAFNSGSKVKSKADPLQAWSGPEGIRKLRFRDFMTTAQDGGKVSLTHRPPLPPENVLSTHFC